MHRPAHDSEDGCYCAIEGRPHELLKFVRFNPDDYRKVHEDVKEEANEVLGDGASAAILLARLVKGAITLSVEPGWERVWHVLVLRNHRTE